MFVVMPFAERISPALGVSLLKSALAARGIPARVAYPSLQFARTIGHTLYDDIAYGRPRTDALLGEWLFAHTLRDARRSDDAYVTAMLSSCEPQFVEAVLATREHARHFVEACVDEILAEVPQIVGFTSSFQQHVPSLAVAKRLKARSPHTTILFGGANCEGDMGRETLEQFDFVDAVVSGEGDTIVPILVERLLQGQTIAALPGVITREAATATVGNTPVERDLDALPYPDFSDYFACMPSGATAETRLNFETSRGCWWGEKNHCTFCGLNGSTMTYRKKSPARALDEIEYLARTYGVRQLAATDNILDAGYFTTMLAELPRRELGVELFYETKSNLRKEQIRVLAAAGVRAIQPGIESLSSSVLALMRKGVTSLRNVQTLKWCKSYGIAVTWNLLYGFPGESPDEYARVERLVPLLSHLAPPSYIGRLRLDRYSPMFERPADFGVTAVEPAAAYAHIYDLPSAALHRLAYYFTFDYCDGRRPEAYAAGLERAVAQWKNVHDGSDLIAIDDGANTIVCDYRPVAAPALTIMDGLERFIYLACDEVRSVDQIRVAAAAAGFARATAVEIEARLATFVERRLLVRDGSVALSLAVVLGNYASPAVLARFRAAAAAVC
ncbi:MAG: RiPP maturation radical SAM C-methyltransferase [Candidatus Eremiobacteraeota bacterium]|nr:RiPP maturation radical SAM C-methyltransferase [Candidatus Eremiobacteraeota bacterium]